MEFCKTKFTKIKMYYYNDGKLEDLDQTLDEVITDLKGKLITYMLLKHNIPWLNDETEMELYDILIEFLRPLILGKILS
jgi:hypothetical protein